MNENKTKKYLYMAIISACISSASILLCMANNNQTEAFIRIVFPAIFWGFIVIEIIFLLKADKYRKKCVSNQKRGIRKHQKAGILYFFSNKKAKIVDVCFLLSLLIEIVLMLVGNGDKTFNYLIIFVIVFSFHMHCFMNGKNYLYIISQNQLRGLSK